MSTMGTSASTVLDRGECVTVVIPCYNLRSYLRDAVHSVQLQNYTAPISIIILDDGSTDDSFKVAEELAKNCSNITALTQKNAGRAQTRRKLLELATTELVAWLDADDLAAPEWINDQVTYLQEHSDCVAVSGQGYAMTVAGKAIGPLIHPLDHATIDQRHISGHANAFFQSCVTLRKSVAIGVGSYDIRYPCAEDYSLWLRMGEVGRLANVDRFHLYYRVHAGSANWTANTEQRTQGHMIMNEARIRRGLQPLGQPVQAISEPVKDDWNRRIFWINIAMQSGNPLSALAMLKTALRRHPFSLLFWLITAIALIDSVLFRGNRISRLTAGRRPLCESEQTVPSHSCYRLAIAVNRWRRSLFR